MCLSAICDLICHAWLRMLFVHEVLVPGGGGRFSYLFHKLSYPTIKEWRWGRVYQTLRWLLSMEAPLRQCWDADAWRRATKKSGGQQDRPQSNRVELDLNGLTEGMQSWFWMYAKMLFTFQASLDKLMSWAEDCSCHGRLFSGREGATQAKVGDHGAYSIYDMRVRYACLLQDSSVAHRECPCRGLRASDFAAGDAEETFRAIAAESEITVLRAAADILTSEDLDILIEDWHNGRNWITLELRERLKFWRVLPWLFAGLMHRVIEKAVMVANRILEALRACTDPEMLPRQARKWLVDPLLTELVQFSTMEKPRTELRNLVAEALRYKWMPTSERPAERPMLW